MVTTRSAMIKALEAVLVQNIRYIARNCLQQEYQSVMSKIYLMDHMYLVIKHFLKFISSEMNIWAYFGLQKKVRKN